MGTIFGSVTVIGRLRYARLAEAYGSGLERALRVGSCDANEPAQAWTWLRRQSRVLKGNPNFNAGTSEVFNTDGELNSKRRPYGSDPGTRHEKPDFLARMVCGGPLTS
ncbi:MAG TPA: hypothetical protein VFG87_27685 [Amycolatopsis sp.]|nr:hypothetical protein [Amycolatopsis sp.]